MAVNALSAFTVRRDGGMVAESGEVKSAVPVVPGN